MKLGAFFTKQWICQEPTTWICPDPTTKVRCAEGIAHASGGCGYRYVASLLEYDYDMIKDCEIVSQSQRNR